MTNLIFRVSTLLFVLAAPLAGWGDKPIKNRPIKNTTPLSGDEIAIYRAVIQQYSSAEAQQLNVSVSTLPLDQTSLKSDFKNTECSHGIELANISTASHSFHELTSDVFSGYNVRLVDPSKQATLAKANDPSRTIPQGKSVDDALTDAFNAALFSMSEIGFDKEHHYAVISYAFWCGVLCGNGATVVFEKVGGEWKKTNRNCRRWVS